MFKTAQAFIFFLILLTAYDLVLANNFGGSIDGTTQASAIQKIVQKLQIIKISDLDFGEASPGDGVKVVAPGQQETFENASFRVIGEPRKSFVIFLPPPNSVTMKLGAGGPNQEIKLIQFTSNPSSNGLLDNSGQAMIYVGASREAISLSAKAGDYSGTFVVTVIY